MRSSGETTREAELRKAAKLYRLYGASPNTRWQPTRVPLRCTRAAELDGWTAVMNINVHIERLILDGLPLSPHQGPVTQAAVEAELARLLAVDGLAAS